MCKSVSNIGGVFVCVFVFVFVCVYVCVCVCWRERDSERSTLRGSSSSSSSSFGYLHPMLAISGRRLSKRTHSTASDSTTERLEKMIMTRAAAGEVAIASSSWRSQSVAIVNQASPTKSKKKARNHQCHSMHWPWQRHQGGIVRCVMKGSTRRHSFVAQDTHTTWECLHHYEFRFVGKAQSQPLRLQEMDSKVLKMSFDM